MGLKEASRNGLQGVGLKSGLKGGFKERASRSGLQGAGFKERVSMSGNQIFGSEQQVPEEINLLSEAYL